MTKLTTPRFSINETETSSDNYGTLINVTSPPTGLAQAYGDGITDDTIALNAMVAYVKANSLGGLYFPATDDGYMIKATGNSTAFPAGCIDGGIIISEASNICLLFENGATLKAIYGNKEGSTIINVINSENILIKGGHLIGDRERSYQVDQFGYGIAIYASTKVTVEGCYNEKCCGDGIFIGWITTYTITNSQIKILDTICDNNRRQGISVVDGQDIIISGCTLTNTNGAEPQSGIDIEPDRGASASPCTNILIDNCNFESNFNYDIIAGGGNGCSQVTISNNTFKKTIEDEELDTNIITKIGIVITAVNDYVTNNIRIINNNIYSRETAGISLNKCYNSFVTGNTIVNDITGATGGILIGNSNNIIVDSNILSAEISGCSGIVSENTNEKINIASNKISGGYIGIYMVHQLSYSYIYNNEISSLNLYGMFINPLFCKIDANMVRDVQNVGLFVNNALNSFISQNLFENVGTDSPPDMPIIKINTAESNFIEGNYFYSEYNTQFAVLFANYTTFPNVISNNFARYRANPFSYNINDIISGNFTL